MHWNGRALRTLQTQLKSLREEPLEGFRLTVDENNLFEWTIGIYGPPDSLYKGGYFKAVGFFKLFNLINIVFLFQQINFPMLFPDRPPVMIFTPPLYHPNIYPVGYFMILIIAFNISLQFQDGKVCISFLHPAGDDPRSGEVSSGTGENNFHSISNVFIFFREPINDGPRTVTCDKSCLQLWLCSVNRIPTVLQISTLQSITDHTKVSFGGFWALILKINIPFFLRFRLCDLPQQDQTGCGEVKTSGARGQRDSAAHPGGVPCNWSCRRTQEQCPCCTCQEPG